MRAVIQRVTKANVSVDGERIGAIGVGLLVLIAVGREDTAEDCAYVADKTSNLRIFPDGDGRFDRSVVDVGGELLLVSQFTLYVDTRKGRRPSFPDAAPPEMASALFDSTVDRFRQTGLKIETGRFQAMMEVELTNDGPVTNVIDSADRLRPRI